MGGAIITFEIEGLGLGEYLKGGLVEEITNTTSSLDIRSGSYKERRRLKA